jgi:hypothetical protein
MGGLVGLAASPKREAGIAEQEHEPRQAIAAFYASLACGLYLTFAERDMKLTEREKRYISRLKSQLDRWPRTRLKLSVASAVAMFATLFFFSLTVALGSERPFSSDEFCFAGGLTMVLSAVSGILIVTLVFNWRGDRSRRLLCKLAASNADQGESANRMAGD